MKTVDNCLLDFSNGAICDTKLIIALAITIKAFSRSCYR